ncbi:MAG: hypothetical protein ACK57E_00675 [Erythrobacteraceae bacterium]
MVLQHLHYGTSMPSGGVHPISFGGAAKAMGRAVSAVSYGTRSWRRGWR